MLAQQMFETTGCLVDGRVEVTVLLLDDQIITVFQNGVDAAGCFRVRQAVALWKQANDDFTNGMRTLACRMAKSVRCESMQCGGEREIDAYNFEFHGRTFLGQGNH